DRDGQRMFDIVDLERNMMDPLPARGEEPAQRALPTGRLEELDFGVRRPKKGDANVLAIQRLAPGRRKPQSRVKGLRGIEAVDDHTEMSQPCLTHRRLRSS